MTAARSAGGDLVAVPRLAQGRPWQEQEAGFAFRTGARTVQDADVVGFVNLAGYAAPTFLDTRAREDRPYAGRVIPGLLTLALAEGLVFQTNVLFHTGIAFLGLTLDIRKPVFVGDTIEVVVEVTESRPTSDGERGYVETRNTVLNQDGSVVLVYTPSRLVSGRIRQA